MKAILPYKMTSKQKQAMHDEIVNQILLNDEKYDIDYCSSMLWVLHTQFGFGKARLLRFWNSFNSLHKDLREHYQLGSDAEGWICREKLKDIGVDVEQLYKKF